MTSLWHPKAEEAFRKGSNFLLWRPDDNKTTRPICYVSELSQNKNFGKIETKISNQLFFPSKMHS